MASTELPSFHGIIGRSAPMHALFAKIERIAPIDVPVLIIGETGTGKELVARAVQQLSRRSGRRFETVNCGALTRELLLSELFGHERGAFTGAVTRKEGLLAAADGGTVFLDEVGEVPVDAQAMLLRFVQHGEIRAVGSTHTRRVDVRLIAATHRDLVAEIDGGTFREDLYYRLRRVVIEVPPLRARREDIAPLVEHIRVQANRRYGLAIECLTPDALRSIENAPWPGNVRQLEAVLEEAMIMKGAGSIGADDLALDRPGAAAMSLRGLTTESASLTALQREALRLATERRIIARNDLVASLGVSREVARRELAGLVVAGLLRRTGAGRGTRYVVVRA